VSLFSNYLNVTSWNPTTLPRTHKVNGTGQPILITIKTGNQMDVIDLENKAIDAKTFN
jgi:hypothetical protein